MSKIIHITSKKKNVFFGPILALVLICFGVFAFNKNNFQVKAAGENVKGYVWSENVGWFDLSGNGGSVVYNSDGTFGGKAWSENIGWLNFAPVADNIKYPGCGFPSTECHSAQVGDDGKVTGWARLEYTIPSSDPEADGWVSLSGLSTDGKNYGLNFDKDKKIFSGQAWSSDGGIGWLDFSLSESTDKERDCEVGNGVGTQKWKPITSSWGECIIKSCKNNYVLKDGACVAPSVGTNNNNYIYDGVSIYARIENIESENLDLLGTATVCPGDRARISLVIYNSASNNTITDIKFTLPENFFYIDGTSIIKDGFSISDRNMAWNAYVAKPGESIITFETRVE